jgi:hypothetical protein
MASNVSLPSGQSAVTTAQEQSLSEAPVRTAKERLLSLDAFRGFTMFWIVGGGALMIGFQQLGHNVLTDLIVRELHHLNHPYLIELSSALQPSLLLTW